uniref:Growth arrest specific 2 like 2 n=1 Tax=Pelodiscus sinensis TaxID=13735 RepID=K7G551_PELSI
MSPTSHSKMAGIQGATAQSIRPYKSSEQYLYAMKEDLAEWLKELYDLDIHVGSLLEVLETGSVLCYHANNITHVAREFAQDYPGLAHKLQLPRYRVICNDSAQPGTFQARDNVSNFIQWCRKEMDIKEVLMFETEDLVLRKNEKNFVLCLLEVARRASRFGMSAPTLIQMEEEIEEEIREEMALSPEDTPLPKPQRTPCDFKNLDQMVHHLVSRCTCPVQFSMMKVSEGKYRVGDSNTLIFVRILRNHVMVRVGGGWDTLEHYLDKHDPCRCTSLSHKQLVKLTSPQRLTAIQVQHEIKVCPTPRTDNPKKPHPTMIVSRSQSPLPPVEWRTYTPPSLNPSWKLHSSSSPESATRKDSGLRLPREQSKPRKVPSVSLSIVCPGPFQCSSGSSQDQPKGVIQWRECFCPSEEPQRGRQTSRGPGINQKDPARLLQTKCADSRPQMTGPQDSSALPPRSAPYGVKPFPQAHSPMKSPVKHKGPESSTKIPIRASPAFRRSPTPAQATRGSEGHIQGRGAVQPKTLTPNLPTGPKDRLEQPDPAGKDKEPKATLVPGEESGNSNSSRSGGDPADCTEERERVYTPLPINRAQEQALYKSLEDEILSNIKVLEADSDESHQPGGNQSVPYGKGVPRSGVYVPSGEAQWPPAGFRYGNVMDELSQGHKALHRVDAEDWITKIPPTRVLSLPLVNGNQEEKKLLESEEKVSIETKGNRSRKQPSPTSRAGSAAVNRNSKTSQAASDGPKASINSPASAGGLEKSRLPQGKPKRSLKKPERVPSIFKLKLRPKIRPRRDNRPEKRPSRIPTPVTY